MSDVRLVDNTPHEMCGPSVSPRDSEESARGRDLAVPPIWVINLRRSTDRRAHITTQLDGLGLRYEFVEAVDGRDLSPEELAERYRRRESFAVLGRELAPGEVGCSLSHLKLYRKLLDEGLEEVVVLEDDAVVSPAFLDVVHHRDALPDDWEVVLLYRSRGPASCWGARPLGRQHRCVRLACNAYGSLAYLLRPSGARKLIAYNDPVRVAADHVTSGLVRIGLRIYAIDPPCVGEWFPFDTFRSTMPDAFLCRKKWPTREELGPALWLAHKCKQGLIHFCCKWNPFSIV